MSQKFVVSGRVFTKGINGIPRYAFEILKRLDKLITDEDIELALPGDCEFNYNFEKIKIVRLENHCKKWNLKYLNRYVKKNKAIEINFSNSCGFQKSIVCLHDIIPLQMKGEYAKNFRKPRLAMKFWMYLIKRHALEVVTVSQFSKEQISKYIKRKPIGVIGNGYEHVLDIVPDDDIFNKFPKIQKGNYFFTLGNVSPHKNIKWVMENAKMYPDNTYVLAGKIHGAFRGEINELHLTNVIYVGYISDGEMRSLMQNAKALLFPTLIEGFGIPPIESLALGTPAVVSDIPCLKEIYGDSVHYLNPNDYTIDPTTLLDGKVESPEKVFSKHNWEKSAKEWYELIKKYNK